MSNSNNSESEHNCGMEYCAHSKTWLYTIARIIVGGFFLWQGVNKFINGPTAVAGFIHVSPALTWIAAFIEIIAGALIIIGLYTRFAAVAGAIDALGAILFVHSQRGWNPMANGSELAYIFLAVFLVFIVCGNGRFALQSIFCKACGCDCGEHQNKQTSSAHNHNEKKKVHK